MKTQILSAALIVSQQCSCVSGIRNLRLGLIAVLVLSPPPLPTLSGGSLQFWYCLPYIGGELALQFRAANNLYLAYFIAIWNLFL
mmetsp:Transcript_28308/g.60349  ORF Transcript_28308/g.60349 Transcript_28308/m.60349 type:complete len:85 (+) Transcript_28308:542-796(+)